MAGAEMDLGYNVLTGEELQRWVWGEAMGSIETAYRFRKCWLCIDECQRAQNTQPCVALDVTFWSLFCNLTP